MKKQIVFIIMIMCGLMLAAGTWEVRNNNGELLGKLTYSIPQRTASWIMHGDYLVRTGTLTAYDKPGVVFCEFQGISFTFFLSPARNLPAGSEMMNGWLSDKSGGYPVIMIRK